MRLGEASTQASTLDAQNHGLELELARANGERDAQGAAAKQKAKEVESQAAVLRDNAEALSTRVAQLQDQETAIAALTETVL